MTTKRSNGLCHWLNKPISWQTEALLPVSVALRNGISGINLTVELNYPVVVSIWHKHIWHTPPATGLEQLPFAISPRQEVPPRTGFAPSVISRDRDPSHPLGGDTSFRNGLGVPKTTHSTSRQENSVNGLVASKPCLSLFPPRLEQWGQLGGFNLQQSDDDGTWSSGVSAS